MSLTIHPLFGALTRPAMIGGVTFEYHMLNLMSSMCVFIGFSPLYGLIFLPLHVFGWIMCRFDPHFYTLCAKRFWYLPQMKNKNIWKVRAYEPY